MSEHPISTWTAFTRDSLRYAALEGVKLANTDQLLVSGQGTLETAVIERPFTRCIVSWNAATPSGSGLLLEARVRFGQNWSKFLRVAHWSADPFANTSFTDADEKVYLETDTLVCQELAHALQIRVTLRGSTTLTGLAATFSSDAAPVLGLHSSQQAWGLELNVPKRSQMIYPEGGRVWCSPTSTTMLLEYWEHELQKPLANTVPEAAQAVWDVAYKGAGNWAFNMAYAGKQGLNAYVAHLSSFIEAERFIAKGIPIALSMGWREGELDGAPIGHSQGHLIVLRGFTENGDPIVNDPAHASDEAVRVIYKRDQLEKAWLEHSDGVAYIIHP